MLETMADACDQVDNIDLEIEKVTITENESKILKDEDFETFHTAIQDKISPSPSSSSDPNEEKKEDSSQPNDRFVIPKDFELLKVIGMGSFGKVLSVRSKSTSKVMAMKVISKRLLKKKSAYIENIQAEREILTKLRHPFVVTMHCSFQSREKLFIIMDFCAGGELFLKIGMEGIFLESEASFYISEIILALEYLHQRHVLHRDLKPENILLQADGHVCVTDFGLAKDFSSNDHSLKEQHDFAMTICGTGEYMAPEMIAKKGYGPPADYWSLGCIAYEMLCGDTPFHSKKGMKDLFRKIMQERVKMPSGTTSAAHKLLKGLLTRDSTKRLGASKATMFHVGGVSLLKSQDFFKDINFDLLEKKEVDPPHSFEINHDADTKHFHEEFISMNLPRSVKMMAQGKAKNTRVRSDTFRGFSFIHEDFQTPDRGSKEQDEYWNSVESDGESGSDAASSKFTQGSLDAPVVPKKRPPRKKKKKQQQTSPDQVDEAKPVLVESQSQSQSQPVVKSTLEELPKATNVVEPKDVQPASELPASVHPPTPQVKPVTKPAINTKTPIKKPKPDPWQTIPAKNKIKKPVEKPTPVEKKPTPWSTVKPAPKPAPIPKAISTLSKTAPRNPRPTPARPAIAVQSSFWPTLGESKESKKQLKGAWAVKR